MKFTTLLLAIVIAASALCFAQAPSTTTIADVVYRSDGTPARSGSSLQITWPAFTTTEGRAVAAGRTVVNTAAGGAVNIHLVPNIGASPTGTYYTVAISLDDGTKAIEYWIVSATTPTTIAAVRASITPTPTVSVLSVSRGGTGKQSYTPMKCIHSSADGSKLEETTGDCGTGGGGGFDVTINGQGNNSYSITVNGVLLMQVSRTVTFTANGGAL